MSLPSKGTHRAPVDPDRRSVDPARRARCVQCFRRPRRAGRAQLHALGRRELRRLHRSPTTAQQAWMRAHYWRMRTYAPYFDSRLELVPEGVDLPGRVRDLPRQRAWRATIPSGSCATPPATSSTSRSAARTARARSTPATSATRRSRRGGSRRPARGSRSGYSGHLHRRRQPPIAGSPTAPGSPSPRSTRAPAASMTRGDLAALHGRSHGGRPRRVPGDRDRPQRRSGTPATRPPTSCASSAPPTSSTSSAASTTPGSRAGTGKCSLQRCSPSPTTATPRATASSSSGRATTAAGRLYGLAAYFLISSGRDGIGNASGGTPADWWTGYDVDLGAPLGASYLAGTA